MKSGSGNILSGKQNCFYHILFRVRELVAQVLEDKGANEESGVPPASRRPAACLSCRGLGDVAFRLVASRRQR